MYFEEISEDELGDLININISSTLFMTHMVIKQMKARGKGAIVNVSSATNMMPVPLMTVYSACKIFVKFFSEGIREEYGKYGLTIQCLSPSYVKTKLVGFSTEINVKYVHFIYFKLNFVINVINVSLFSGKSISSGCRNIR